VGSTSRKHSQNVLLPVEIPPVIPMAGIQVRIKSSSRFKAASFSTSVTICPNPHSTFSAKTKNCHAVNNTSLVRHFLASRAVGNSFVT
jgi:hypothetical protein